LYLFEGNKNGQRDESNLRQIEDHEERLVPKKVQPGKSLGDCLRKAWRNEKLAMLTAKIENRPTEQPKATEYRPELLKVPTGFYGVRGMYYGD
jgi:hypothetical protein